MKETYYYVGEPITCNILDLNSY